MTTMCFIFTSLLLIFSICSYRYAKRKEGEGIAVFPPSAASIVPIILLTLGVIICFLNITGLWGVLVNWLQSFNDPWR